jgi:YidC/Oxa1 family membrane protein insertase
MRRANSNTNPMQDSMMKTMMYVMPPLMFLGTAWLPAGLQWFFLNLSIGSVVQSFATINPAIRRWAGLPPLPDPNNPKSLQYQAPAPQQTSFLQAASKTLKETTGATEEKARWKKAQEYEEQRAEEEKQKAFRRMEEVRRRRSDRVY